MFELLGAGIVNVLQAKYLLPLFLGTLIWWTVRRGKRMQPRS